MITIPVSWSETYEFACRSAACAPPPAGTGGSRPGRGGHSSASSSPAVRRVGGNSAAVGNSTVSRKYLDDNETVPVNKMGMRDGSDKMVKEGRDKAAAHDWDKTEVVTLPRGAVLVATERSVKTKYIKRVMDGEPLREGYEPQLVKIGPNKYMVYDGHHRMAMHSALGNKNESLKVRIAEIPGMPSD